MRKNRISLTVHTPNRQYEGYQDAEAHLVLSVPTVSDIPRYINIPDYVLELLLRAESMASEGGGRVELLHDIVSYKMYISNV